MKKRIFTIMLVFIMVLTVGVPVLATENPSPWPSPSPLAPETGNLHIYKYTRGSSLGDSNEGVLVDPQEFVNVGAEPLAGIWFDVYKIGDRSTGENDSNLNKDYDVTFPPTGAGVTYELDNGSLKVTISAEHAANTSNDSSIVLTYALDTTKNDSTYNGNGLTDEHGLISFENLDRGYYLVVEDPAKSTVDANSSLIAAAPFIVAVPMTNPNGDGWLTDVYAYPKNELLEISKEVNVDSASIGGAVRYTIEMNLPSAITDPSGEEITLFEIQDELDSALKCDLGELNAVVSLYGIDNVFIDVLDADSDYKFVWDDSTKTLKIVFVDTNSSFCGALAKFDGAHYVRVSFDLFVNQDVIKIAERIIKNKASAKIVIDDEAVAVASDPVDVHTGQVIINKTDEKGEGLDGAEFAISTTEAAAKAGYYIKIPQGEGPSNATLISNVYYPTTLTEYGQLLASYYGLVYDVIDFDGKTYENDAVEQITNLEIKAALTNIFALYTSATTAVDTGTYFYYRSDFTPWSIETVVSSECIDWIVTSQSPAEWDTYYNLTASDGDGYSYDDLYSNHDSIAVFAGLQCCDFDGNPVAYYVVETKAPDEYNLYGDVIPVAFDHFGEGVAAEDPFTAWEDLVNTTEFILPQTGGIGTILFTVGGIVIMGSAVILIVSSKKTKRVK